MIDSRLIAEQWIPLPSSQILPGFNQLPLKGRHRRRLYSNPAWRLCTPEGAVECGGGVGGNGGDYRHTIRSGRLCSNNWKPDVGTRGDTQEVGDKLGSEL